MSIYVGCPIWSFKGWVGNFYPKGTRPSEFLFQYARRLTNIEGNTTFYAVPSQKTIENWVENTPDTFRFCPKIPKRISHEGRLAENIDMALGFVDIMRQIGIRLGPMFLQLPPRYSPSLLSDLHSFLSHWPRDVRLAVEVRHIDWFGTLHDDELDNLLSEHDMARVTIDTRPIRSLDGDKSLAGSSYQSLLEARERKPDVPVVPKHTSNFVFARYIGHPNMEINRPFLNEWGSYFSSQIHNGTDVYAFCHSPDNLIAPNICRELHRRVAADVNIPPLPWDDVKPEAPQQDTLF